MPTERSTQARVGRLVLVAASVALVGSLVAAATPPGGAAADPSPIAPFVLPAAEPPGEPSPTGEASPMVDPSPTVDPSASSAPSPPAASSEAVMPSPSVAQSPSPVTPSPSALPVASPAPSTPAPLPTATLAPTPTATPTPAPTPSTGLVLPASFPSHCTVWENPIQRANLMLGNRYHYASYPVVALGSNPTWTEDPLASANWRLLHHSLRSTQVLLQAYSLTGDVRYRDRATFLLKDWLADNPRSSPPSAFSWNDHSTALRANAFACAALYLPREPWLVNGLLLHGRTLAEPSFYVYQGNHALDQSMGLLEVGGTLQRADWMQLARDRIETLLPASVDAQGVTNEQAIGYQNYNRVRYTLAEQRLRAWGLSVPAIFSRIRLMPSFLAHGTRPDGRYEMIGDTNLGGAAIVGGTIAEFAATLGRSGPRPATTVAVYRAGFMFARTGWGGPNRPITDERYVSLRWGPAPIIHGHADGGSVRMYGYGTSLLVDPGGYTYNQDIWRTYFKGRTAHNVVTVDGVAWNRSSHTTMSCQSHTAAMSHACIYQPGNAGVSHERRVTFSRSLGYMLVEDRLSSSVSRTYRQLWHLPADAKPFVKWTYFNTQRGRGNVQVRQLIGGSTSRVVLGQTAPVQGWVAYRFGEKSAAPVVEVAKTGKTVRFVTLLVTAPGAPQSTVSGFQLTSSGYRVIVTVNGRSELVVVSGSTASITPIP